MDRVATMTAWMVASLSGGVVVLGIGAFWVFRVIRLRGRLREAQAERKMAREANDTELARLAVQKVSDRQMRLLRLWPWTGRLEE